MPFGAQLEGDRTRFRLWAPSAQSVELVIADTPRALTRNAEGWYELSTHAPAGTRYHYRVDGKLDVPDPASRFNPDDVHGRSEVVDPGAFEWRDESWAGRRWTDAIIYELHVGTFSPAGTYAGVEEKLDYLASLGVTAIELMPLADFPGRYDWGYDGALQYAPDASYGRPEDLKRLVCAAHARGLMVFLDVVYNHFGPEGNYLHAYASPFFTERHQTAWGAAINFDANGSRVVRDFFIHNALYWLEEFHFDGLRFDAVHAIADDATPDILTELAETVRASTGAGREIHLVLENDDNAAHYLERGPDGRRRWYNAQWNDDLHHCFHVLLTGERAGYYEDYASDTTRKLGRCLTEGFAYQGEPSTHRNGEPRGESTAGLPLAAFVSFLQNHDQTGNRAFGERLSALASERALRAATLAWLLAPQIPLLFMGEEFAAATPFLFFCDFGAELAQSVTEGRRREFARFAGFNAGTQPIPDPNDRSTFERSKLDWSSLGDARHASWLVFYKEVLAVRMQEIGPRLTGGTRHDAAYTVLGDGALLVQWVLSDGAALTLRINLSERAVRADSAPAGELLRCEPEAAAEAYAAGELPPQSAAVYLLRAEPDSLGG